MMNAYLLSREGSKLYLSFGENATEAATSLIKKIGGNNVDEFSVGGSWEVNPNEPIDVSSFWPYFTNNSQERDMITRD